MSRIISFLTEGLSRACSFSISEEISKVHSPLKIVLFLLTILLVKLAQFIRTNQRLPPGPSGYPYLGMIPKIKKEFHLQLFDYSKSFGKIFSLKMGNQLIVVLSDHKLIKSAFGKSEFAARPKTEFGNMLGGYGKQLFKFATKKKSKAIQFSFLLFFLTFFFENT